MRPTKRLLQFSVLALAIGMTSGPIANAEQFKLKDIILFSGGTLYGTIDIDTVAGVPLSADVFYKPTSGQTYHYTVFDSSEVIGTPADAVFQFDFLEDSQPATAAVYFVVPGYSLVGFTGGLCTLDALCDAGYVGATYEFRNQLHTETFVSGNLVPVTESNVPEPASLALLVSGVLGATGMVRRKRQSC